MNRKLQIGLLLCVLLVQFVLVFPAWAKVSSVTCQSPCECGPGWYCDGDWRVAYQQRLGGLICEEVDAHQCYYGCECCPCDVDDVCLNEGACQ